MQTRPLRDIENTPQLGHADAVWSADTTYHPAPERVRLDPVDRETVQAQQKRRVRAGNRLNMRKLRRLEQARDLTSIMILS